MDQFFQDVLGYFFNPEIEGSKLEVAKVWLVSSFTVKVQFAESPMSPNFPPTRLGGSLELLPCGKAVGLDDSIQQERRPQGVSKFAHPCFKP